MKKRWTIGRVGWRETKVDGEVEGEVGDVAT